MASSFMDENIDPTLREMTPAQLEKARQNSQQLDLNHSLEEQEMSSNDLSTVAQRLKCKLELSEEAEADLDDFCAVPPEERQLLLMKNIWLYVKAFLLSSTGVCYVGDSSVHVMIKDLIRISMQNDKAGKAVRNIAHLTKKLIGKSKSIPQTQQLYMCLSIARYIYASMPLAREDNYWEEVDRMLHGMRENGDDMFVFCLNDTYQQDIKKHGNPAKSGIKSVEIKVAKVPNWVHKINELTPKVQISEGEGDRPAKQQRVDAFGDEDGNDLDDLDDEDTNSQSANDTNHQVPPEN
ncbi:hypothetical protein EV421DRAFT_1743884 [Armillaria borealis]|uniref:Uncharacterized protein n=1 Tax=Armillaria borealis TaxID=47425 RepID=A0AA39IVN7_9AGAR|nr:hypothetical protein EV421DRAFT_1743884 [Armillaria borealis]